MRADFVAVGADEFVEAAEKDALLGPFGSEFGRCSGCSDAVTVAGSGAAGEGDCGRGGQGEAFQRGVRSSE